MSVNSLPSFAQAFSNHSLSSISGNNALPPIMPHGRKRTNDDPVRVKDESPEPDDDAAPPPSSLMPSPLKKRRVTVSGTAPHPLHIDVRPTQDQSVSTPISPVVIGFSVQRDNPADIEKVRSTINIMQKQQAIIDQRRGSAAGIVSPTDDHQRQLPPQPPPPPAAPTPRTARRSPNMNPTTRRQRAASPQPTPMQLQQQQAIQQHQPQNSLPPPPISFARRRAALLGGKKKPADIVISPREAHTRDQFQPSIQSAPPIPHAGGQNAFYSGRFQMALPRLPNLTPGTDSVRRVPGNVPPTPTRLSLLQNSNPPLVQNRSPPAPSVPISSALVPPTPTSLHRPGYQGDKAAFLQPFEVFYDALNDSKQLKTWLGEQLHKSQTLMQNLAQQQDRINDTVESLVEKRVSGMKSEMTALRRRVEDLEEALRSSHHHHNTTRRASMDLGGSVPAIHNNNKGQQNGVPSGSVAPEPYTFPPVSAQDAAASGSAHLSVRPEPTRRLSSPGWGQDRQQHASGSDNGNGTGSPVPFDARRMSTSATRHEPPPPPPPSSTSRPKQSPPQVYRDGPKHVVHPPMPPAQVRVAVVGESRPQPPPLTRQGSSHSVGVPLVMISGERERERERDSQAATTARRAGSRRNSVVMSPPEEES